MDVIIKQFCEELIITLPMDDVIFRTKLHAAGLFHGNLKDEVKTKPTSAEKAEHFLDNGIKNSDDVDRLITVMEGFNSDAVNSLAKRIRDEYREFSSEPGNCIFH